MRLFLAVLAASTCLVGLAHARSDAEDRADAIRFCRTAIVAEVGADANVRFDHSRTRPREVWAVFRVRDETGVGRNAECVYDRRTATVALTRESSSSSLVAARER
jgi:hypothetical protein